MPVRGFLRLCGICTSRERLESAAGLDDTGTLRAVMCALPKRFECVQIYDDLGWKTRHVLHTFLPRLHWQNLLGWVILVLRWVGRAVLVPGSSGIDPTVEGLQRWGTQEELEDTVPSWLTLLQRALAVRLESKQPSIGTPLAPINANRLPMQPVEQG